MFSFFSLFFFFFFNDTATTEIYTLSLHDALPISPVHTSSPAPAIPSSVAISAPSIRYVRAGTSMRPRLDFSTDSTLLPSSSGSRTATSATRATAVNARLPRIRLTGSALSDLPRCTSPTTAAPVSSAIRPSGSQRGADLPVTVGFDPAVHHRGKRIEHQQGNVVRPHVGAEPGGIQRQAQSVDAPGTVYLNPADHGQVGARGHEPRDHGELPCVLTGGEHHPGQPPVPAARERAAGELGGELDAHEGLADALTARQQGQRAGRDPVRP